MDCRCVTTSRRRGSHTLAAVPSAAHLPLPATQTADPVEAAPWTPLQKLGFRLLFTIGGGMLIVVGGVILLVTVNASVVNSNTGQYPLELVIWPLAQVGSYLTQGHGVEITKSAGSDMVWFWCCHLGWIVLALPIAALWTVLDRRRADYRRLAASLIVFSRFGLALAMIYYGMGKVIPVQMGFMALPDKQLPLTGDTSLFKTLWGFMAASEPYSVAAGLVEVASGVLLLWHRTWLLGALVSVMATAQVFILNMAYDVPVKLVAGELFVMAIGITAPYWPNLVRVVFNRGGTRPLEQALALGADRRWLRRTGAAAKFGVVAILLTVTAVGATMAYTAYYTPTSTLDGVGAQRHSPSMGAKQR